MNLTELRKLAEAADDDDWDWWDFVSDGLTYEPARNFVLAANPATILAMCDLIAQCKEALVEFDGLIKHQYCGTSEGMTDLQYAVDHGSEVLAAIEEWEKK
jgi:hypothetical protein